MPTRVGLSVGEFVYHERFKAGAHGNVLVGEINHGTVAKEMLLYVGSGRSLRVIDVEAYGNGTTKFGILVLASEADDVKQHLVHGARFEVMQHVSLVKRPEDSRLFENKFLTLLDEAGTLFDAERRLG